MYRIEIEAEAEKALRRLPRNTAKLIRSKLLTLAADPYARNPNVKKLTGREGYRLRVGKWRALYTIDPSDEIISVMVIKPRGGAYEPEYAVITIAERRRIEALIEEPEDIRDLDAALAKPDRRMIPFEVTSAILDGASPIRAWREHRGLSRSDLAETVGIAATQLAEIEDGKRSATPATLRKLAVALRSHVDDLTE